MKYVIRYLSLRGYDYPYEYDGQIGIEGVYETYEEAQEKLIELDYKYLRNFCFISHFEHVGTNPFIIGELYNYYKKNFDSELILSNYKCRNGEVNTRVSTLADAMIPDKATSKQVQEIKRIIKIELFEIVEFQDNQKMVVLLPNEKFWSQNRPIYTGDMNSLFEYYDEYSFGKRAYNSINEALDKFTSDWEGIQIITSFENLDEIISKEVSTLNSILKYSKNIRTLDNEIHFINKPSQLEVLSVLDILLEKPYHIKMLNIEEYIEYRSDEVYDLIEENHLSSQSIEEYSKHYCLPESAISQLISTRN